MTRIPDLSSQRGDRHGSVVNEPLTHKQGEWFAHTVNETISKLDKGEAFWFQGYPVKHRVRKLIYLVGHVEKDIPIPF